MKKNMTFAMIGFLFFFSGIAPTSGEAVLLYLESPRHAGFAEGMVPLAAAMEDGIMEYFFEHGHLIFNAGLRVPDENDIAGNPSIRDPLPSYLAKAGGASFLLEVYLDYVPGVEEGTFVPTVADYSFSTVSEETLLSSGDVDGNTIKLTIGQTLSDLCLIMGKQVATKVLNDWRDSAQTPTQSARN